MINPKSPKQLGFTLIELSIVLVIIGLIVGGVLAGRDLIKAAQLRKIYSEYQALDTAANTYRLKYNALAGDHANAYQFFGDACGTNTTITSTGCNGDGNAQIGWTGQDSSGEEPKFFEHLSRAGIIAGNYDGSCLLEDSCAYVAGTNVPSAALHASVWGIMHEGCEECSTMENRNVFIITASMRSDGSRNFAFLGNYHGTLMVQDMWSIDSKYDDGIPNTGKVLTMHGVGGPDSCVSDSQQFRSYNLTTATEKCNGYFRMSGF